MASTVTLAGDWLESVGNKRATSGTINLGIYATNGVAVSAAQVGLGVIDRLDIQPTGGYVFEYIPSTGKVKAYRRDAHTHDLSLKNAAVADGATTRVNAGTNLLGANTGGDLTIAGAGANGGVANSTQAPLAEVSNAVDISSIVAQFRATGR